ncbi:MAG: thiosulfohydrolase SoxB [Acidobacteriaceae bacterium]|nr:thiosulfohydrolase SoxB [Acidobacteriaceae bacterium]
MKLSRRSLLASAGALPFSMPAAYAAAADMYDVPLHADARIIHITDTHAQANPVQFREPSVNIGVGAANGRPPHLVGEAFLKYFDIPAGGSAAHAFTFLDFERAAHKYGPMGGFAHLKTLIDQLRNQAGASRTMLVDGGDLTQGSGVANLSSGQDMIALANILGTDVLTGHWEFTYGEDGLAKLIAAFKGKFVAQNVFLTDDAAFANKPAFDPASGHVFPPFTIREMGGYQIGVIGQAFPYVPIAHPSRFVPDWTFGIHPDTMQKTVNELRNNHKVDAVVLLSHNGMDTDLALAAQVSGIDIIMGGHTHDAIPIPQIVKNPGGKTFVTNAGSAGKFVAVLDLSLSKGALKGLQYRLLPVYSNEIKADPVMAAEITKWRAPHQAMLEEKLADVETLLYRRGNFTGTMDQMICDALLQEMDAQIVLSPGFRWGNTVLAGGPMTMEDLLSETAMTYGDVYVSMMTGAQIKAAMEDVCDNLFNPDPFYQQGGDMVRVGGMNYACAPNEKIGNRISEMTLTNGQLLDAAKTYKVAGWASVSQPQNTPPVWDVVAKYLRDKKTVRITKPNVTKVIGIGKNAGYAP